MQGNIKELLFAIQNGDQRALARGITIVENELNGYEELLLALKHTEQSKIIGITGPPGAGKSTLVNSLLAHWNQKAKKVAVIAIDPSSPFNYGALLGDRIRMSNFYDNPNIFIRSMASRGALGGLNAKIIEVSDVVKNGGFDYILVETVGVGQSEVEIAGLADTTVVALVPEAGDEVQTIKAGIMEIADIFVVNKADREEADRLYRNLKILAHEKASDEYEIPVVKTIATKSLGIEELAESIDKDLLKKSNTTKRIQLLTEKCWQLIEAEKMRHYNKKQISEAISTAITGPNFNLYSFTKDYLTKTNLIT